MKSKKVICIVSLMYLLILFSVNLMSQDFFAAKEELIVFRQANFKSDTTCTIHINDKVEVVEIKKVWLKKWAKIQNSKGVLGYVLFNKLKPIDTNQEIQKENTINEELSTQNTAEKELDSKPQNGDKQDSYKEPVNTSNENIEKISTSNDKPNDNVSQTNEHSKKSFPAWGWFVIIAIGWLFLKFLSSKSSSDTQSSSGSTFSSSKGSIKRWGGSLSNSWEWDGKCLKLWGGSLSNSWEWDGKSLKRWGGSLSDSWEWDGKCLKRWGGGLSDSWEWDGKCFKRWGGSLSDSWERDGKYFKRWGGSLSDSWEIEGNIPIPVIAKAIGLI